MKTGKNITFMLDFVRSYADGNIERWEFDLDYDAISLRIFRKWSEKILR